MMLDFAALTRGEAKLSYLLIMHWLHAPTHPGDSESH